jgi:hypothetical protein
MNPTRRPDEHSCRNAVISQNCSRLRTLRHRPLPRFEGDSWTWPEPPSGNSSSSSSRKRDLGSSGKCGTRHRGGAARCLEVCRRGWPCFHLFLSAVFDRTSCGRYGIILSSPGIIRYACDVIDCSSLCTPSSSAPLYFLRTGSSTLHHHLINWRSSLTCLLLFSTLPGKRY